MPRSFDRVEAMVALIPADLPCAILESSRSLSYQRFSGAMFSIRAVNAAMSARLHDRCTLTSEGGRFATESPSRHSLAGRIGLGTKPPPQFGQTSCSLVLTQSAQNVHSNEHIRASVASGGRSLSQYSQFGRSCKAIVNSYREQQRARRFMKPAHFSISAMAIYSSCLCACSIEPGPQMIAGMPAS